jgi:hypothetical protein
MAKRKTSPRRILNCIPSLYPEKDWLFKHAGGAAALHAPVTIPPAKDLRENWWKIGDQGSTGSCVGWATADSVLRWHFVKANRIGKNDLLSPRFTWMASKETDDFVSLPTTFIELAGTSLKTALDISRKFGAVQDNILPFGSGQLYPRDAQTFYAIAAQLKIAGYFSIERNLANWRAWLAERGPILTRLDVDATWENAEATEGRLDVYQRDNLHRGHAVALVGYTSDRFIVRNSWGVTWGDKGFGYASVSYAQEAFTEAYGISL